MNSKKLKISVKLFYGIQKHFLVFLFFIILPFTTLQASYTDYLAEYFKNKELTVTELQGGLSNSKNYKITTKEKDYVLRILNPNSSIEERRQEIAAATYAGELEIGPHIFYEDPIYDAIIMDFVKGETLNPSLLKDKKVLIACLQHIQRLHRSTGNFPQGLTVFERIKSQLKNLKQSEIPAPIEAIDNALLKLCNIEKIFYNHALVPCHNDLNALNVILDRTTVKFIDWTDSGMGYAYNELGYFVLVNQIEEERYDEVLEYYLGVKPSVQEIYLLKLMKKINTLRIFASNFPAYESPVLDLDQRIIRTIQLENLLWDPNLLPVSYFIDMHIKGKLCDKELVVMSALSSLRSFLSDDL